MQSLNKEDKKRAESILKKIAEDKEILFDKHLEKEDYKMLF